MEFCDTNALVFIIAEAKYIYAGGQFQYNPESAAVVDGSGLWDLSQALWTGTVSVFRASDTSTMYSL